MLSPSRLLRCAGASPPHSPSSGAMSLPPSPSQSGSSPAAERLGLLRFRRARGDGLLGAVVRRAVEGFVIGLAVGFVHGRIRAIEPELLARRFVGVALQKRVVVQHLLDLGDELERGQLQQPDRLLQLRRQREVLRRAQLKTRGHAFTPGLRSLRARWPAPRLGQQRPRTGKAGSVASAGRPRPAITRSSGSSGMAEARPQAPPSRKAGRQPTERSLGCSSGRGDGGFAMRQSPPWLAADADADADAEPRRPKVGAPPGRGHGAGFAGPQAPPPVRG